MQDFRQVYAVGNKVQQFELYKEITLKQLRNFRQQFNENNPINTIIRFATTRLTVAGANLEEIDRLISAIEAVRVTSEEGVEEGHNQIRNILSSAQSNSTQNTPAQLLATLGVVTQIGNAIEKAKIVNMVAAVQTLHGISVNLDPNATIQKISFK